MIWWWALVAVVVYVLVVRVRRRRRLAPSRSPEYQAYMRSPEWKARRAVEVAAAGHRCTRRGLLFRCRKRRRLSVHHWTYAHLGAELAGELQVFCPKHHARADAVRRRREARR